MKAKPSERHVRQLMSDRSYRICGTCAHYGSRVLPDKSLQIPGECRRYPRVMVTRYYDGRGTETQSIADAVDREVWPEYAGAFDDDAACGEYRYDPAAFEQIAESIRDSIKEKP